WQGWRVRIPMPRSAAPWAVDAPSRGSNAATGSSVPFPCDGEERIEDPFDQPARIDHHVGFELHARLQGRRLAIGRRVLTIELDRNAVERLVGGVEARQSGQLLGQLGWADRRARDARYGARVGAVFLIGIGLIAHQYALAGMDKSNGAAGAEQMRLQD